MINYIQPNWPAPKNVKAYTTTRTGGYSVGNFVSLNLADHVDDDPKAVTKNRQKLRSDLKLPGEPCWLQQKHTTTVLDLTKTLPTAIAADAADASFTNKPNQICAVLTADCLPLLICDKQGTIVAAIHAGWQGLAAGIIEKTVKEMRIDVKQLLVWFGPAIGPTAFFVGEDVYRAFITHDKNAQAAFTQVAPNQWLADIYLLARQRLAECGVMAAAIYGGEFCTYTDAQKFFSYRRDNKITGRMASLIWLT